MQFMDRIVINVLPPMQNMIRHDTFYHTKGTKYATSKYIILISYRDVISLRHFCRLTMLCPFTPALFRGTEICVTQVNFFRT